MLIKRNWPLALLILVLPFAGPSRSSAGPKPPHHAPTKYEKILHDVGEMLAEIHYSPRTIDDSFSREVFRKYLNGIDPEKKILMQADIASLRRFENTIDDEINGKAPVQFAQAVNEIYRKRLQESEALYKDILSHPFDYTKDEYVELDENRLDFPKNEAERKEGLRKRLKFLALEKYSDLLNLANSKKDSATAHATKDQLEAMARQKAMRSMDLYYARLKVKANDNDRFNEFVETIVQCMDPHTDYFPPVEKRSFDEDMSGRFFGIGASLKDDDGTIKIGSLLTGSPAWKSGQVNVGDAILKVGQGSQEPVDLTGYTILDAVKIIRGAKGTEVRLTLKKADGTIKVISLIRDEIVQDEKFARSVIVNTDKGKIGYIYLPEFYADFENNNGNRCYIDVAKELVKLKEENVDGIVLDLRNNPGGSLGDVVEMVGLFVNQGPVVQVKGRGERPMVLEDHARTALYTGPLTVMVNEFSASASEIFAAAIQDYKRGIIIGSTSTFGKGTVQRPFPLERNNSGVDSGLGTIKLTMEKFYRISGGSTQLRGVASDIVLPDAYEHSKYREKDQPDALPYDVIARANYNPFRTGYNITAISGVSNDRIKNNAIFSQIGVDADWLDKESDQPYPLNLDKYRQRQQEVKDTVTHIEKLSKLSQPMNLSFLAVDSAKYSADKDKGDRYRAWLNALSTDIYLKETVNVIGEIIAQKNTARL
ncbi:MAG TPA: carboxy terminal-processing peptidase [Puia sp.]|jgi:carboxyl-terminal processing protease|nr:carboxy terminal-processing peptidase [Puia sp.]